MLQIQHKADCCGCSACSQICPKQCITMQRDEEGFSYPVIDTARCVDCGLCEKVCPVIHGETADSSSEPAAYAARSCQDPVRLSSSSGGVFSLLAQEVLAQQGVVYGAAMTSVTQAAHIRVCQPEQLSLLRGSKYIQSHIGQAYLQVKEDLKTGKPVLFSGTPCQTEGLLGFLGKDWENLICVDIICHGVPSPMVWEKYVQYRQKQFSSPAVRVNFRHKRYGWKEYSMVLKFANGKVYTGTFGKDLYMQAYLHDLCLRPSCHQCRFKKTGRPSDITLADFWGIEQVCPEQDDNRGTSLVMLHSEKGQRIFQQIRDQLQCRQVNLSQALRGNPSMVTCAVSHEARDQFLRNVQTENFRKAVRRHVKTQTTVKELLRSAARKAGIKKPVDPSLP